MNKWLLMAPVASVLGIGAGVGADRFLSAAGEAKQDLKPAATLPHHARRAVQQRRRVLLPLRRSGGRRPRRSDVPGSRHQRPAQEHGPRRLRQRPHRGGQLRQPRADRPHAVSFAINLNGNPTFAGIVAQMRGERIEVAISADRREPAGQAHRHHRRRREAEGARRHADRRRGSAEHVVRRGAAGGEADRRAAAAVLATRSSRASSAGRWKCWRCPTTAQKKAVSAALRGRRQAQGAGGLRRRSADLEDQLPAGAGGEGEAVPARLGDGREPDRRGLDRREDGAGQRPADQLQDGPVQPAVRQPARRSSRNCSPRSARSPTAAASRRSDGLRRQAISRDWTATSTSGTRRHRAAGSRQRRWRRRHGVPSDSDATGGRNAGATAVATNDAQARTHAKDVGDGTGAARSSTGSVGNAATAGALGDFFQYAIDHPVTLPRQKTALLPIVGKDIEGTRVSIYNPGVQAKHPLLGLAVQEHHRRAPEPGADHGVRGQRLRRRHPRARRAAERGAAAQLRHRPGHGSRSEGRRGQADRSPA